MADYYVYILTKKSGTLYVGVTNDLQRRIAEHRAKVTESFTSRYDIGRLVYFESTADVNAAIRREKEIKGWVRKKKVELIRSSNLDGRIWQKRGSNRARPFAEFTLSKAKGSG